MTPQSPSGSRASAVPKRRPSRRPPAAAELGAPPRRTGAQRGRSRSEVGWVKAHGGAGASTLAEAVGGVDIGGRWPRPSAGEPSRFLIVGRTNAHGLQSVSRVLGALEEGNASPKLELLGVVLVADAPGLLPLSLLRRIRVIRSVTHVHRVPWIPAWRVGDEPTTLPRQLASLITLVGTQPGSKGRTS
ncbi:hypothetical protein O3S80_42355 [Streptomyces sp. Lzd4kr]|nr:hypothetical protein [Streptomyces sp. Lzd4kr]